MIKLIEKIVFSGANGTILIIPLIILIYVAFGQVEEFISIAKEIWREGESNGFKYENPNKRRRAGQEQF